MQRIYKTKDGEIFENRKDAEKHESVLFQAWVDSDPSISVQDFLDMQNDDSPSCDCCSETDRDVSLHQLKRFWRLI